MEYLAPYGSSDPNAAYVDRSTPNAQAGSKVPAGAVEHPQREIVKVIMEAGLTPDKDDLTQLWQAIKVMIESVRVNLPMFPNVLTTDGKIPVTPFAPGTIRIPAGVDFTMRGGRKITTLQTDRSTLANTTYHLRYTEAGGFLLKSLSDTTYNPGGVIGNEVNASFDSTYDDMLVAKVVTNGSNAATITNLVNRDSLATELRVSKALPSALNWATLAGSGATLNWARKPKFGQPVWQEFRSFNAEPDGSTHSAGAGTLRALGIRVPAAGVTRYGAPDIEYWYEDDIPNEGFLVYIWTFFA